MCYQVCVRILRVVVSAAFAAVLANATFASASPATVGNVPEVSRGAATRLQHADFAQKKASAEAVEVADWIVATADNRGLPFIIVDKANATLFLFQPGGQLHAATPVLVGSARGDDSPPGIGDRKLSEIRPSERITPAGRFVAHPGEDMTGRDILWIDYDAAVALHRAPDPKPGMSTGSRVQRLASTTTRDNRASLGCVNVTNAFYDSFIVPFGRTTGIVYILPETRSAREQFNIVQPLEVAHLAATASAGG